MSWNKHLVKAGSHSPSIDGEPDPAQHREHIEPWLSALFQAEHLNVLVGSGFTTAIAHAAGSPVVDMSAVPFKSTLSDEVIAAARKSASTLGRGEPNIEDQMRTIIELIAGLQIIAGGSSADESSDKKKRIAAGHLDSWTTELEKVLSDLMAKVLATERGIYAALTSGSSGVAERIRCLLGGLLLPFGSRMATRERAHIFTLNYDRLIELGCDILGLRLVDRFVGTIAPVFHSSRLGIDLHYNPPGIRGEPRYLEGVLRFTKLHGSVDWRSQVGPSGNFEVQRNGLPFGATDEQSILVGRSGRQLLIYPNAAKDVETLQYPYAELFRDFAASVCLPNSVVMTYGYGFGDDHVNRVLRDMLSIPSTHLVIVSYNGAGGRIQTFCENAGHEAQITLLVGSHFGDLGNLVEHYLPKPAIDRTTWRMVDLLNRRTPSKNSSAPPRSSGDQNDESSI